MTENLQIGYHGGPLVTTNRLSLSRLANLIRGERLFIGVLGRVDYMAISRPKGPYGGGSIRFLPELARWEAGPELAKVR